jgi:hypothetical protein
MAPPSREEPPIRDFRCYDLLRPSKSQASIANSVSSLAQVRIVPQVCVQTTSGGGGKQFQTSRPVGAEDLGEMAEAAARGDSSAETAVKIVEQAARLGQPLEV